MKLIKPSYQILDQPPGLDGIYQQIEMAGRTCYRSQRPEGQTAKDFVDRMINSKHYAMLEHGTVYLKVVENLTTESLIDRYRHNKYSVVNRGRDKCSFHGETAYLGNTCITTNYRVLVENGWLDDLKYLCEPTEYHEKRVTVRFTTDRGVSHEFVRHRVFSFAQESTRYCNYSKDKFNNEIIYILPSWCPYEEGDYGILSNPKRKNVGNKDGIFTEFVKSLQESEHKYFKLLHDGWKPQQARQVLPNALKTELVMTGFVSDWQDFFDLRAKGTTGAPHPDAKALAEPLMGEFYKRGYIK